MTLTATMFGVGEVNPSGGGGVTIGALVVISGPELTNGPTFQEMSIDVDLTQTLNQIYTTVAAAIRANVLAQFHQTIPANGVNMMTFTKG